MAFDSVFQGPPSDTAAPGTRQSPSLGVDVTNRELYISSGQGWQELSAAGGSTPGGVNGNLQFNNSGTLSGTSGGQTNGTHFAMGPGATVDGNYPSSAVLSINETNTTATEFTGLSINANYNPTVAVDGFGIDGAYIGLDTNLDAQPTTLADVIGLELFVTDHSTNANGPGSIEGLFVSSDEAGSTNSIDATRAISTSANHTGSGSANFVIGIEILGGTIAGTVGSHEGLRIEAMQGGTQNYQIRSLGTAQSLFLGPVNATLFGTVVYSATTTVIPSASSAGVGARAFVSDATLNTFNSVYASGGTNKVPVFSDGTSWRIG